MNLDHIASNIAFDLLIPDVAWKSLEDHLQEQNVFKNHLLLLAAHICPEFPVLLVDKSSADFALRVFSKNIEKETTTPITDPQIEHLLQQMLPFLKNVPWTDDVTLFYIEGYWENPPNAHLQMMCQKLSTDQRDIS